jgi:hypothetical protein
MKCKRADIAARPHAALVGTVVNSHNAIRPFQGVLRQTDSPCHRAHRNYTTNQPAAQREEYRGCINCKSQRLPPELNHCQGCTLDYSNWEPEA